MRNCSWAGEASGSGKEAKEVLLGCLLVLLWLIESQLHQFECVRALVAVVFVWRDWYFTILGACYSDECNEATLAQLGRLWRCLIWKAPATVSCCFSRPVPCSMTCSLRTAGSGQQTWC